MYRERWWSLRGWCARARPRSPGWCPHLFINSLIVSAHVHKALDGAHTPTRNLGWCPGRHTKAISRLHAHAHKAQKVMPSPMSRGHWSTHTRCPWCRPTHLQSPIWCPWWTGSLVVGCAHTYTRPRRWWSAKCLEDSGAHIHKVLDDAPNVHKALDGAHAHTQSLVVDCARTYTRPRRW